MTDAKPASEIELSPADPGANPVNGFTLRRLKGGFLIGLGYLLSPLCWWNDLVFNLPIAYCFGYVCSWVSADFFLPGTIAGYWLSNVIGIVLMQVGVVDVVQKQPRDRSLKKDIVMGIVTSTLYTVLVLGLVYFKILDVSFLFPADASLDISSIDLTSR
ncbi:hypothetical protein IQ268_30190 [Oculatella sp. LEGE 06141]|nr:hypothetical protein [Oculatella sp. LEGE 06141]